MKNEELLYFSIRRKVHKINSHLKNNWDTIIEEIRLRCAKYDVDLSTYKLRLIESEIYSFTSRFNDEKIFVNITVVVENISVTPNPQFVTTIMHNILKEQELIDGNTSITIIENFQIFH